MKETDAGKKMSHIYMPILMIKRAECRAVGFLSDDIKERIKPCFIVPPFGEMGANTVFPEDITHQITKCIEYLELCWDGNSLFWQEKPFFLHVERANPNWVASDGKRPLVSMMARLFVRNFVATPVTGLSRNQFYLDALKGVVRQYQTGCAFRVFSGEINADAQSRLLQMKAILGLPFSEIDLMVDWGFLEGAIKDPVEVLSGIPNLREWRTISVGGGAFPKDLSRLKPGISILSRRELDLWASAEDFLIARGVMPIYADYASRHPVFDLSKDKFMPSPSYRLTAEEDYEVIKGRRTKDDTREVQFKDIAEKVVESNNYPGNNFSWGDRFIRKLADGRKTCGNSTPMIQASVNHHITLNVRKLMGNSDTMRAA